MGNNNKNNQYGVIWIRTPRWFYTKSSLTKRKERRRFREIPPFGVPGMRHYRIFTAETTIGGFAAPVSLSHIFTNVFFIIFPFCLYAFDIVEASKHSAYC
ncbi:hypothetical protein CC79DRAFT_1333179 [Sarocladium strictum]|jgi:hypothetical protein